MEMVPCVPVSAESACQVVLAPKLTAPPKMILSWVTKETLPVEEPTVASRTRLLDEPPVVMTTLPEPLAVTLPSMVIVPLLVVRAILPLELEVTVPPELMVIVPVPAAARVTPAVLLVTMPESLNEATVSV